MNTKLSMKTRLSLAGRGLTWMLAGMLPFLMAANPAQEDQGSIIRWLSTAAVGLGGIGIVVCGVMLAGAPLWPQIAEQYKKQLQNAIFGFLLVGIGGYLANLFTVK